ncbi:hypothetical protein N4G70_24420 [Streptomyces sp. ASQP_92]|uniref:hypothetical protein n=1 Tax=Streptomyces sp. ASQP_92 TaxID=2979116 RepID=UPI0021C12F0F|nr:hypothetical protein [Streptomyces sp. ASQP_92]MCT9091994.1 hypothetical protein [Streptomyces sp. ASQP_92]
MSTEGNTPPGGAPGRDGTPQAGGSFGPGEGLAGEARPAYTPGSVQPRLNRPVHERYPQIRATSGYGDPRVRHTGPGPGAGTEQEPERSSKLTARLTLAITVVIGQLWGLTVVVNEWMRGNTGTAWWGAGFLCLSFLVVLGLWALDPKDR